MPVTTMGYKGQEPDAAWRKEALARIDQVRKGDLTVEVVDAAGQPVAGAKVDLRMQRHAFPFGATFNYDRITMDDEDSKRYVEEFKKNFNLAVYEGATKWPGWVESGTPQEVLKAVEWQEANGIALRGHVMVYPKWRKHPAGLKKKYGKDPAGLQAAILDFIKDMGGTLKGHVVMWDVVNEHSGDPESWTKKFLPKHDMVDWFKTARATDPDALLILNDNGLAIAVGGTVENPKQKETYELVDYLKAEGAPIDGVGLQSRYFWHRMSPPEASLKVFDRFSAQGMKLAVTEFDILVEDEDLQADLMRDYLIASFSNPQMHSFTIWGFWDGQHHKKNAALFRRDWTLKPSGKVYRDLVFDKWWTNETGETGPTGEFATRGFYGGYQLTVEANGQKVTRDLALDKSGETVTVKLAAK